jgi:hypothetical protein
MKYWMMFALSAALFWGAYVPTIFYGQMGFGATNPNRSFRAFLFIGVAYVIMAIVVPAIWIWTHKSSADGGFTASGAWLSTLAGLLGAAGALCVVFALRNAGIEGRQDGVGEAYIMYVAPIVFAGAPIINVLISWIINAFKGEGHAPNLGFIIGMVVSIVGVTLVLLNNPAAHGADPKKDGPATTQAATKPSTTSAPSSGPSNQ